jgi:hypothetical protein
MSKLEGYSFGRIVVDGTVHEKDLIILPSGIKANWWRRDGHSLVLEDLDEVLDQLPEHLIVGTGAYGRMQPDPTTVTELEGRGINVETMTTDRAVERYEQLDEHRAAAALHLTC